MLQTFIRKAAQDDASLDRYWVSPRGIEYHVNGYKGTHMQWIFNNQDVLDQQQVDEIEKLGLEEKTIENFAGVMYELGWVRISENAVLMNGESEMTLLAGFIENHSADSNIKAQNNMKITVIQQSPEIHTKMSVGDIMKKYYKPKRKLAASFDKISSRDAVKDTIDYWDKAKNKDFSKYYRKLKKNKKKKANYIPNPDTKVPQPLKRNFDCGEIPNYVDRLKWHNKKERRENRKKNLNQI
jgi:hypothetical protein